ncbi:MAG: ribosome recycling factor [Chloroflexi bacterium]|nr:ribosome recycling factor [Chloroflexota bacterium]MBL7061443.1 ribosome recycling factor [Dehalococcoidia bacterium]
MIEQILTEIDGKMKKAVDALTRDLASIRTGRASPALVEHIKADYHGVLTPINQIASISIPEAKMILIQPWDRSSFRSIEKAILTSDLSLNPTSDSNVIRIPIPPLTEERRRELIKLVHKRVEEARIALRNLRREAIEKLRQTEKNKEISQDQYARASEQLQKLTDGFIEQANDIGQVKETEIMEV